MNINKDFFKSYKKNLLAVGLLTGNIFAVSIAYLISDSQNLFCTADLKNSRDHSCYCNYEPQGINDVDQIIWDKDYINDTIKIYKANYLDTPVFQIRIFRGTSKSTHYRFVYLDANEESEWKPLPENDLIVLNIQDIPEEIRYNQSIGISFGIYNQETNTFEEEENGRFNWEYIVQTSESQETLSEHEEMYKQIMSISNKLVSENDSDFDKVKKIYDYLIMHAEYRNFGEGIYSQSIFKKYYMACDGYASFMNIALNSVGVECFYVQDDTHGHVWNIVKVDDKYYHLDACYSDTSSWVDTSKYRYFLVSDDFMLADHRFFVSDKDVTCNDIYDLTGMVSYKDVEHRGFKGEEINLIEGDHLIGEYEDSAYVLLYRLKPYYKIFY